MASAQQETSCMLVNVVLGKVAEHVTQRWEEVVGKKSLTFALLRDILGCLPEEEIVGCVPRS